MAWPPSAINATKAPGAPSSDTEHPDHHNAMATAINEIVAYLQALAPAPDWTEVEVDFGSVPSWSSLFTITDAAITAADNIVVNSSAEPATGRVGNDSEWDGLVLSAVAGTGEFTLTALAVPGPVMGRRKVLYVKAA